MSSTIPVGCASALISMVNYVEAGGAPYPLFFQEQSCASKQFPAPGNQVGRNWDTPNSFAQSDVCPNANPDVCVPAFQSAIIPNHFNVKFTANWSTGVPSIPTFVSEQGEYDLCTYDTLPTYLTGLTYLGNVGSNIWLLNPLVENSKTVAYNTGRRWHYVTNSVTGPCGTATTPSPQGIGSLCGNCTRSSEPCEYETYSSNGLLVQSIFSCGSPFWPTFGPFVINSDATFAINNGVYWQGPDAGDQETTYCVSAIPNLFNFRALSNSCTRSNGQCANWYETCVEYGNMTAVGYTALACLTTEPNFNKIYTSEYGYQCGGNAGGTVCSGPTRTGASVGSYTVTRESTFATEQIAACLGTTISIGGFEVQRYANGTPACDVIMADLCSNTAAIAANPAYQTACTCILEQKRLELQYAGLDMPVECFSEVCNVNTPGVYRTSKQKLGCNARICLQIVNVNGSDIVDDGYQSLTCNGQKYDLQAVSASGSVVLVTPTIANGKVHLGIAFFVALGVLGITLLLLLIWGVRKGVLQKRKKDQQRRLVTRALTTALTG